MLMFQLLWKIQLEWSDLNISLIRRAKKNLRYTKELEIEFSALEYLAFKIATNKDVSL